MPFLKSFAYAAIAVVGLAVAAAIVVTPAAIALAGPRLDSRRLKYPPRPVERTFFYRLARFVMRRAVPIGLALAALLVVLGMPLFGMKWGIPDDRVLPTSSTARQVGDQLRTEFSVSVATSLTVVLADIRGVTPKALDSYASQLSLVPDVPSVSAYGPVGERDHGRTTERRPARRVWPTAARFSPWRAARRFSPRPPTPSWTGCTRCRSAAVSGLLDQRDRPGGPRYRPSHHLPPVPCPDRHRPDHFRGDVPTHRKRDIAAENVAAQWLISECLLRRTRMDFPGRPPGRIGDHRHRDAGAHHASRVVLHRVRLVDGLRGFPRVAESRVLAGIQPTAADNDHSVALGLARTGRVITAAALIMSISFAALIAAQVSFMRMFGVGLTLAVLSDATLVRMLLVPAFMHVMGRANWWAPKWVSRLRERSHVSDPTDQPRHLAGLGQKAYAMEAK